MHYYTLLRKCIYNGKGKTHGSQLKKQMVVCCAAKENEGQFFSCFGPFLLHVISS